jgi:hypothetical protein
MSRTVPSSVTPELAKVYTEATWLIKWSTVSATPTTYYLSTRGEETWDGQTWGALGASVVGVVTQDRFSFSMPNTAGAILGDAADKKLKRAPVTIYVMYPAATGTDDAVLFMHGTVASVKGLATDRATFHVERYGGAHQIVPTVLIAPPDFSKLPPVDLRFRWGGRDIVLGKVSSG